AAAAARRRVHRHQRRHPHCSSHAGAYTRRSVASTKDADPGDTTTDRQNATGAMLATRMAMTLDDVDAFVGKLPGVTVGAKWGNRTWMVNDNGFAWARSFHHSDLTRV